MALSNAMQQILIKESLEIIMKTECLSYLTLSNLLIEKMKIGLNAHFLEFTMGMVVLVVLTSFEITFTNL